MCVCGRREQGAGGRGAGLGLTRGHTLALGVLDRLKGEGSGGNGGWLITPHTQPPVESKQEVRGTV